MVAVPDDALVVRGGDPHDPRRLKHMVEQAETAYRRGLGYALSVYAGHDPALGREDLIRGIAAVHPIPNSKIAVTTAAQLIGINCELIADRALPCHVRVVLGTEPDPKRVQDFIDVFGPAENNPVCGQTRRGGDDDPHRRGL
jgi:hypothetical protein